MTACHRLAGDDGDRDAVIGGRYLDRMDRRGTQWRIAHRTMLYDWSRDLGESIDWSQGLMGLSFSDGHYTGRSAGDHSETFFGRGAG